MKLGHSVIETQTRYHRKMIKERESQRKITKEKETQRKITKERETQRNIIKEKESQRKSVKLKEENAEEERILNGYISIIVLLIITSCHLLYQVSVINYIINIYSYASVNRYHVKAKHLLIGFNNLGILLSLSFTSSLGQKADFNCKKECGLYDKKDNVKLSKSIKDNKGRLFAGWTQAAQ